VHSLEDMTAQGCTLAGEHKLVAGEDSQVAEEGSQVAEVGRHLGEEVQHYYYFDKLDFAGILAEEGSQVEEDSQVAEEGRHLEGNQKQDIQRRCLGEDMFEEDKQEDM